MSARDDLRPHGPDPRIVLSRAADRRSAPSRPQRAIGRAPSQIRHGGAAPSLVRRALHRAAVGDRREWREILDAVAGTALFAAIVFFLIGLWAVLE